MELAKKKKEKMSGENSFHLMYFTIFLCCTPSHVFGRPQLFSFCVTFSSGATLLSICDIGNGS